MRSWYNQGHCPLCPDGETGRRLLVRLAAVNPSIARFGCSRRTRKFPVVEHRPTRGVVGSLGVGIVAFDSITVLAQAQGGNKILDC